MLDRATVEQIQQASVAERIQLIELVLQSFKKDIAAKPTGEELEFRSFKVRPFNLGQEVRVDRGGLCIP